LGKDSFKEAYTGIAQFMKETDKKISDNSKMQDKLRAKAASCAAEKQKRSADKLGASLNNSLSNISRCSSYPSAWCDSQKSALDDLINNLNGMSDSIEDTGVLSTLNDASDKCVGRSSNSKIGEASVARAECDEMVGTALGDIKRKTESWNRSNKSTGGSEGSKSAK
jgi:hypothetical protein